MAMHRHGKRQKTKDCSHDAYPWMVSTYGGVAHSHSWAGDCGTKDLLEDIESTDGQVSTSWCLASYRHLTCTDAVSRTDA